MPHFDWMGCDFLSSLFIYLFLCCVSFCKLRELRFFPLFIAAIAAFLIVELNCVRPTESNAPRISKYVDDARGWTHNDNAMRAKQVNIFCRCNECYSHEFSSSALCGPISRWRLLSDRYLCIYAFAALCCRWFARMYILTFGSETFWLHRLVCGVCHVKRAIGLENSVRRVLCVCVCMEEHYHMRPISICK